MKKLILLTAMLSASVMAKSFDTAKNMLYMGVYGNSGKTIYCGCEWDNRKVDLASCGLDNYFTDKHLPRAMRTEAEHIIPASWMLKVNGIYRDCAIEAKANKKPARKYCQSHDAEYKRAHNDLVNLFPAVGQINADRSNKPYSDEFDYVKLKDYASCESASDSDSFTPRESMRGDIARVAFYMRDTYHVMYSKHESELFNYWDGHDPVSQEEIDRNKRIVEIQGYGIEYNL